MYVVENCTSYVDSSKCCYNKGYRPCIECTNCQTKLVIDKCYELKEKAKKYSLPFYTKGITDATDEILKMFVIK